jgi:hypothetical protein
MSETNGAPSGANGGGSPAPASAGGQGNPAASSPETVSLPGVRPEDTSDPFYRASIGDVDAAEEDQPQGRIAGSEESGAQVGEDGKQKADKGKDGDKAEGGEQAAKDEKPAEQPAKFKFADAEFDSVQAAEHSYRTLRGLHKGMQARERRAAEAASQATTAALAWKAEAERLQAESAQRGQSGDTAQPGQETGGAEKGPIGRVDWALYQQLYDEHGPKVASAWLFEQTLKAVSEQTSGVLNERLAPIDASNEHAQAVQALQQIGAQAKLFKNQDGSPAYPELHNDEAAREVGFILGQLGLPPDTMFSQTGLYLAIATYRDRHRRMGAGKSTNNPAGVDQRGAVDAAVAAAEAAAKRTANGAVSGAQPPSSPRPATAAASEEQSMLASIRNAGSFRGRLGFRE